MKRDEMWLSPCYQEIVNHFDHKHCWEVISIPGDEELGCTTSRIREYVYTVATRAGTKGNGSTPHVKRSIT